MLTSRNHRLRLVDDRISDLPDSLLLHILSFILTRWAAKTCILSKRWKPLWTSVPALIFESFDVARGTPAQNLLSFAKKILQKNDSPWIQTLRVLYRGIVIDESEVESLIRCIESSTTRKVTEIDLDLDLPHVFKDDLNASNGNFALNLPQNIFTCRTLVVLKLNGEMRVTVPTAPYLPNLKTMVLHSVFYFDENYATYDLITCCPELENLSIFNVHLLHGTGKFLIHARKLKCLELGNSSYQHESIQYDIDAPSLEFLNVKGCTHNSLSLTNVGGVKKANICWPSAPQSLVKCFQACNNLNLLSLSNIDKSCPVEVIDFAGLEVVNLLNLTHITVEATSSWRSLLPYFFLCCPNLQVLKLVYKDKSFSCLKRGPYIYHPYLKLELLQKNLLSKLRVVELEDSWNCKDDLDMLKYILQNGKVLESVRIHVCTEPPKLDRSDFSTRPGEKAREFEEKFLKTEQKRSELELKWNIIQEVSSCCRASAACQITYS